jgi:hypothetical protein
MDDISFLMDDQHLPITQTSIYETLIYKCFLSETAADSTNGTHFQCMLNEWVGCVLMK